MLSPREEFTAIRLQDTTISFQKIDTQRAPEQIIGFQRYIALSVNSTPI